ncbi:MAG: tetratricopeptide repeat protein [Planctomycetota bacterium]|nr:tetratricopeptide repeat protein [Planctomycetota bacterium]
MPAHRILFAVVGLGLVGMLPVLVAAQTQPGADAAKAGLSPKTLLDEIVGNAGVDAGKAALSAEQVFSRVSPAVVRVVVRDRDFKEIGFGSGFFVAAEGLLVTNHHVVRGAVFATALRADGSTLFVDGVLALDEGRDLAVLKVNGTGLPCLEVAPADAPPPVGTQVYAVGNPLGQTNTFSNGMVSGIRKEGGEVREIQTNAAISPGSSGGPLVDAQGRVVGVIKYYMVDGQALNFAVPAAAVRALQVKAATAKPAPLASAGGKPLDAKATRELDAAWAAMDKKRWSDAAGILTGLRSRQPDNPFVWYTLGYLHMELRNLELAVEAFKTAILLKPDFVEAYGNLGWCYAAMGNYADAVVPYKMVIQLKSDDAKAYRGLAGAYRGTGRYSQALDALRTAIRLEPRNAYNYTDLAETYIGLNQYDDAARSFKIAADLDPKNLTFVGFLVTVGFLSDRPPVQLEFCKAVIRIMPDFAEAYCFLGLTYDDMGRWAEAIEASKTAIRLKPDLATAYRILGLVYCKMGNRAEALRAYQTLQRLDPAGAEILRVSIERLPESTKQSPDRLPHAIPRLAPR